MLLDIINAILDIWRDTVGRKHWRKEDNKKYRFAADELAGCDSYPARHIVVQSISLC